MGMPGGSVFQFTVPAPDPPSPSSRDRKRRFRRAEVADRRGFFQRPQETGLDTGLRGGRRSPDRTGLPRFICP